MIEKLPVLQSVTTAAVQLVKAKIRANGKPRFTREYEGKTYHYTNGSWTIKELALYDAAKAAGLLDEKP